MAIRMTDAEAMTGEYAVTAIRDKIIKDTCADLKARVMAIIEPQIDHACEVAALSLKPTVEAYLNRDYGRQHSEYVVRIITEKREQQK